MSPCFPQPLLPSLQVLFHDVTFTMGQVVSREGQGRQETLFRCIRSMPSNPDWAYNSCYSAGESLGSTGGWMLEEQDICNLGDYGEAMTGDCKLEAWV